ncbi:MAG: hypothetical protein A3D96_02175 [Chlamydiae bacterium RIFCSPHIGHO2_12_FULL_44_59]|nr:MAG: hypothetical protein A2796_04865 [Chlamydiae bacterium RIFCSPHIGHO2_01_FULL_44_39]OGN57085.1 MAG: hypothetical protein A3C42_06970 [Chlamydiae bacterium RIFCSPHIGHO2_02_FULL_45_9]OGN60713.1 MAG: hypothetical protein A3D96_02175 [Chlamydiae bacterium RIFCSPHIGHO2_12_FULL_44_59]OGN66973.1 MAG: hypothetical protein A2978_02405 [Chlamydiae bacterium RIFCSPLOWO2_01_FULL_44_52]OGN67524.1 MAG: hypothetical protein A3I67_03620 [Chlamydiae bacterium RIFCSPLOWO2_02_FULL_45_22]OGN71227.1 MAG: hyp
MFFYQRKISLPPLQPLIQCFVRYATYSEVSYKKKRPLGFSYQACHENLLSTADHRVAFTFFLDCKVEKNHFLRGKAIEIQEGTEAGSFIKLLEHVKALDLHPETIVYLLEDDYIHRPGWVDALFEGLSLGTDYVTLYDHSDKYTAYPKLTSKIFATASCHWRTTPSTTNTYAMRFRTLARDFFIHKRFSLARKVSADHNKFCFLNKKGRILISAIPGFSTHLDPEFLSPCIDWALYIKEGLCEHSH